MKIIIVILVCIVSYSSIFICNSECSNLSENIEKKEYNYYISNNYCIYFDYSNTGNDSLISIYKEIINYLKHSKEIISLLNEISKNKIKDSLTICISDSLCYSSKIFFTKEIVNYYYPLMDSSEKSSIEFLLYINELSIQDNKDYNKYIMKSISGLNKFSDNNKPDVYVFFSFVNVNIVTGILFLNSNPEKYNCGNSFYDLEYNSNKTIHLLFIIENNNVKIMYYKIMLK